MHGPGQAPDLWLPLGVSGLSGKLSFAPDGSLWPSGMLQGAIGGAFALARNNVQAKSQNFGKFLGFSGLSGKPSFAADDSFLGGWQVVLCCVAAGARVRAHSIVECRQWATAATRAPR